MNLKPREKQAILAGDHPEIVRPHEGKCPFDVGEKIVLRTQKTIAGPIPQVSIEITAKHRKSPTSWEALYQVKDERGLYLAPGSSYTRSAGMSIDAEAPVDDPEALQRYAQHGEHKTALRGSEQRVKQTKQHKELRAGEQRSARSAKAVARHQKSAERRLAAGP